MILTSDNLEVVAARYYTNERCLTKEEFLEDLGVYHNVTRLARKIYRGSSCNMRLLVNHIVCFSNNFDINFVKVMLTKDLGPEVGVILAAMVYLGMYSHNEYQTEDLDFHALKLLKEMD